mgnify:CR=1 FL=1
MDLCRIVPEGYFALVHAQRTVPWHKVIFLGIKRCSLVMAFSRGFDHVGCASIWLVNRFAVTHSHWNGAGPRLIRLLHVQSHPPLTLISGSPTLSPEHILCPCNDQSILPPPPPCKWRREMAPGSRKHLRDENLKGYHGHFLWYTPIGGHWHVVWPF